MEQRAAGTMSGFLIVWSDVRPDLNTDYLHWFTREHALERVSTPGFLSVRLFTTRLPTAHRYLILYDLESPEVVSSPAYVAKLNQPSQWTQRVFPTLTNFMRAGGRVAHEAGMGQGSTITALTLPDVMPDNGATLVADLVNGDRISAARLYETDRERTSVKTKEKEVRGGDDRSFAGMLVVEGLDEQAVRQTLARQIAPELVRGSTVGTAIYNQVFCLQKRDT